MTVFVIVIYDFALILIEKISDVIGISFKYNFCKLQYF